MRPFFNSRYFVNTSVWFYWTNVSTLIKALRSSIYVFYLSRIYNKNLFLPGSYLKQWSCNVDTVIIYGGSYNLIEHAELSLDKCSGSILTLAINTSAMAGLPVDIAFWELWNKTPVSNWFDDAYVSTGRFTRYTSKCRLIVLTRIFPSLLSSKFLNLDQSNILFSIERSLHVNKFLTSRLSALKQITKYLDSRIESVFWFYFLPTLRGSLIRAIMFALKIRPKKIIICGMSQGKQSLHWFDRNDRHPHLKDYSEIYSNYYNPRHNPHRTNISALGRWTVNSILPLFSSNDHGVELYVATLSGLVRLDQNFNPSVLDPF